MKNKASNYSFAVTIALLPLLRYISKQNHTLLNALCIAVCLFFLLQGLYYRLLESESGRAFLRKIPFLKIPEENEETDP